MTRNETPEALDLVINTTPGDKNVEVDEKLNPIHTLSPSLQLYNINNDEQSIYNNRDLPQTLTHNYESNEVRETEAFLSL